jgi:hypothetical protein
MQSIGEAVRNADLAQGGFASLIDRAAVNVFKFKDLMSQVATQEGEDRITRRVSWANAASSAHRAILIDAEDEWSQVQVAWSGIPEIMDAYLLVVAGAADIPMTRLLGQSPRGLQSTGDGEERDYQSMIKARQDELLAPALNRIDEVLIPSALGSHPSDIYYVFGPLQEENEKDGAAIEKQRADTIAAYATSGLIPDVALSAMAKNSIIESNRWPGAERAFEEAANEPLPKEQDPGDLQTLEQRLSAMEKGGTINAGAEGRTAHRRRAAIALRQPQAPERSRVIKWAKGQGFTTTVPADELHVTVLFSRTPVDWLKMGSPWDQDDQGRLKVAPGGARVIEPLGDKGAVVLLFNSSSLSWRHEEMVRNGASHDYDEYQPHVTITYEGSDLDLSKVEPYRGELVFGPEVFAEVEEDWEKSLSEE